MLGTDQCPLFGVERCLLLRGSKCISSMVKSIGGQVSRPLYRGGSVIRGFTVYDLEHYNFHISNLLVAIKCI